MNLVRKTPRAAACGGLWILVLLLFPFAGCGPRVSSPEQLATFNAAGPAQLVLDVERILKAKAPAGGPYRVVAGDVLELRMQPASGSSASGGPPAPAKTNPAKGPEAPPPAGPYRVCAGDVLDLQMAGVLRALGAEPAQQRAEPYTCRVNEGGAISLPAIGEVSVAGKTLAGVDKAVIAAYFPKYVRKRPSVIARVTERRTFSVSVAGAVARPGKYPLHGDEMSLVPLLMKAGGIVEGGAAAIWIRRAKAAKPLLVPVKAGDIPAVDAALREGDSVEVEAALFGEKPYICRASESGGIHLPVVGQIPVAGKTLAEIETVVVAAYWPKYVAGRPSVMAKVAEYRTATVSVVGGVGEPGKYALRSDELSLLTLLKKAGGIVPEGAADIRIRRVGQPDGAKPLVLPVSEQNVPFADIALTNGDTVEVQRLAPEVFTVVGLVNRAGVFPYPPNVSYTLQQALAIAGGIDSLADPRHTMVYRQDADGRIVTARFKLGGPALTQIAGVRIKPGDVITLKHTFRTRARSAFFNVFQIGAYVRIPLFD